MLRLFRCMLLVDRLGSPFVASASSLSLCSIGFVVLVLHSVLEIEKLCLAVAVAVLFVADCPSCGRFAG